MPVVELSPPGFAGGDGFPEVAIKCRVLLAGFEDAGIISDRLGDRVARGFFERGIHVFDAPVGVGDDDGVRALLDGGAEILQFLLRPLAFGDVAAYDHRPGDFAVFVPDRSEAVTSDPRFPGILAAQGVFGFRDRLAPERPGNRPHVQRCRFPVGQEHIDDIGIVRKEPGAIGLVPEPVKRGKGVVKLDELAAVIGNEHGIRHAAKCRMQLLLALPQRLLGGFAIGDVIKNRREKVLPVAENGNGEPLLEGFEKRLQLFGFSGSRDARIGFEQFRVFFADPGDDLGDALSDDVLQAGQFLERPVDRKINPILSLAVLVEEHLAIRAPFVHTLEQQAIRLLRILRLPLRPRPIRGKPLPEPVEICGQAGGQQKKQRDAKADGARVETRIGEDFVLAHPKIPVAHQQERQDNHHKNPSCNESGFSVG